MREIIILLLLGLGLTTNGCNYLVGHDVRGWYFSPIIADGTKTFGYSLEQELVKNGNFAYSSSRAILEKGGKAREMKWQTLAEYRVQEGLILSNDGNSFLFSEGVASLEDFLGHPIVGNGVNGGLYLFNANNDEYSKIYSSQVLGNSVGQFSMLSATAPSEVFSKVLITDNTWFFENSSDVFLDPRIVLYDISRNELIDLSNAVVDDEGKMMYAVQAAINSEGSVACVLAFRNQQDFVKGKDGHLILLDLDEKTCRTLTSSVEMPESYSIQDVYFRDSNSRTFEFCDSDNKIVGVFYNKNSKTNTLMEIDIRSLSQRIIGQGFAGEVTNFSLSGTRKRIILSLGVYNDESGEAIYTNYIKNDSEPLLLLPNDITGNRYAKIVISNSGREIIRIVSGGYPEVMKYQNLVCLETE